jgi:lysophospholipase L1-like esterase
VKYSRKWFAAGSTMIIGAAAALAGLGVSPAAAKPAPSPQVYVALGDSFSAGPFILPQTDLLTCARSARNYPGLLAGDLAYAAVRDVTCSSATTAHFSTSQAPNVPGAPPAPPQYDALSADTTLVTVGIGGNDIGLVGLAEGCINLLPAPLGVSCKQANGTAYEQKIDAFAPTYGTVIDQIRSRAPQAKIVMVGYPSALPAGGCYPLVPVWAQDADYIQSLIDRLNARMKEQARLHRATYVDTRTSSIGHDACQLPGVKWIEGLVPTSDASPLHPNALGMQNDERQVLAALLG